MDVNKSSHWFFSIFLFHKEWKIPYSILFHHSISSLLPFSYKSHVMDCTFLLIDAKRIGRGNISGNKEAQFHDLRDIVLNPTLQVSLFLYLCPLHYIWIITHAIVFYKIFYLWVTLFIDVKDNPDMECQAISLTLIYILHCNGL